MPGARVAVGRDRPSAIERFAAPAELVLLDDAFQNPAVYRDFDLVLIDASRDPFAGGPTGRCLPAGWLREPVENLAVYVREELDR